ncbi:MAG: hypothetical protein ACXWQQ_10225 [Pseudobdellovibrio sp.]
MFSKKNTQFSHESFNRKEKLFLGSDSKFGYTFSVIFFILAVSPTLIHFRSRVVFIFLSLLFAAAATFEPKRLHKLNLAWARFGILLNKIISPIVLLILFYLVFLPLGAFLRVIKKDILNLTIDKNATSYWIDSTQFEETSMKDQF